MPMTEGIIEIVVTRDGCLLFDRELVQFRPCPYWDPEGCTRPTGCLTTVRALGTLN